MPSRLANYAPSSGRRRREDQRQDAREEASEPGSLLRAFFRPSGIRHSRRFEPFITAGFPRRSAARGFSEGLNGSTRLFPFIITDLSVRENSSLALLGATFRKQILGGRTDHEHNIGKQKEAP
jgi:hypothetical protein